jgi:Tfp pilus assembly protein PilO
MNFSKLSKEKKQQLFGVVAGTVAVLGALGYFLIKGGYEQLGQLNQKKQAAEQKLDQMRSAVKRSAEIEAQFAETEAALMERETTMANGDLYSWIHENLRRFQRGYKVEIPQISQVTPPTPVDIIPDFPYQQTSVEVSGTAYYHDLGRFVADFENQFPLMRIQNLALDQNTLAPGADREKLLFRMNIVALIKPKEL